MAGFKVEPTCLSPSSQLTRERDKRETRQERLGQEGAFGIDRESCADTQASAAWIPLPSMPLSSSQDQDESPAVNSGKEGFVFEMEPGLTLALLAAGHSLMDRPALK